MALKVQFPRRKTTAAPPTDVLLDNHGSKPPAEEARHPPAVGSEATSTMGKNVSLVALELVLVVSAERGGGVAFEENNKESAGCWWGAFGGALEVPSQATQYVCTAPTVWSTAGMLPPDAAPEALLQDHHNMRERERKGREEEEEEEDALRNAERDFFDCSMVDTFFTLRANSAIGTMRGAASGTRSTQLKKKSKQLFLYKNIGNLT